MVNQTTTLFLSDSIADKTEMVSMTHHGLRNASDKIKRN